MDLVTNIRYVWNRLLFCLDCSGGLQSRGHWTGLQNLLLDSLWNDPFQHCLDLQSYRPARDSPWHLWNRLLRHIVSKCYPGQIQWCIRGTSNTISLVLEVLFCVTLIFAAAWNRKWTNERLFVYVHGIAVKVLAYFSATFIIGVKFIGPQARNKSSHPQSDRYGDQIRGLPPTLTCCEYLPEFHNWHICGLSRGCFQSAIFSNFWGRYIAFLEQNSYSWARTMVPIILYCILIIFFC